MNKTEIQAFIREHGVRGFVDCFEKLLRGHELPNGAKYKVDPYQCSFKEMWEGMVGPIRETFDNPIWRSSVLEAGALDATGFPSATEKLISSVTIDAYESAAQVADLLVPRSVEPKTLTERIVGFTSPEGPKPVLPGEDYPKTGFGEKYVTFEQALHNKKEGVEIQVTEEAVRLDQTNSILDRAAGVGMTLRAERERRTVRAVLGIGTDTGTEQSGVYFPNGTDTALYRASVGNLRTDSAPIYNHPGKTADSKLEDFTDIQEVLTIHAQKITDDRQLGTGRPIIWNPDTLLVPVALATTAANILNATSVDVRSFGTSATTFPEITGTVPNPLRTVFRGALPIPVSSPYVDEVSSTVWVLYDRQKTFVRINIFPFQVFRSPAGYGWNRDVVAAVRVREWSRVIARDFRHAIRSDGA